MKNLHLVPVNIQDLVEKLSEKGVRENEHFNYMLRLEAIRDFCDLALKKSSNKNMFDDLHKRKANSGKIH